MNQLQSEWDRINADRAHIVKLVRDLMHWDREKALSWLHTSNPHFGSASPYDLVKVGRTHKVLRFIEAAKDENSPPEIEKVKE